MLQQLVLGNEADLPKHNKVKEFTCGDKTLCIANMEGVILAVDKDSLHGGGPFILNGNEQSADLSLSPNWRWTPPTSSAAGHSSEPIAVYPVKIENNKLVVQLQMAADQEALTDHDNPSIQ
ncbi:MAG TPA: hypothetical protein VGP65_12605 [Candidatus Angelobacter sp.]|jgi:hypothetical protein|nr:hypothetical protein [Candidatus Angelobacter sp.]